MKSLLLVLTLTVPLAAQTANQISTVCGAPVLGTIASFDQQPRGILADPPDPARPSIAAFARASQNLLPMREHEPRVIIALVSKSEINANAHTSAQLSIVCIPSAMVDFMGNEDEIAFIVAHELGHTIDSVCFGQHNRQDQVACEMRADEIGFQHLILAGYSPYAAAGAFGRLEMYSGDTSTGLTGLFRQLGIDHPITPNRITNMRRLLLSETHQ
jgi:predicted Zn-dependent protease